MKPSVLILTATAALALAACSKSEGPVAEASAAASVPAVAEAMQTAPQPAAAMAASGSVAFTKGEAPSKAFMAGTWGDGEACELPIDFQADGTIKDGPFEKWDIQDGYLVMEGAPQKMKLRVIDEKTMESQLDGSDKVRTLKRC